MADTVASQGLSAYLHSLHKLPGTTSSDFINTIHGLLQEATAKPKEVKQIMSIVFSLLTSISGSSELENNKQFLFSDEVRHFVQMLVRHTNGSTAALVGIAKSVYSARTWHSYQIQSQRADSPFPEILATLLLRWFMDDQGHCIITQPGGLRVLLEICSKCVGTATQCSIFDKKEVCLKIEQKILPMFKDLISKETKESLNMAQNEASILHYAAVMLQMPEITLQLLEHTDIDINVQTQKNMGTTLSMLIESVNTVDNTDRLQNWHSMVKFWLNHPKADTYTLEQSYQCLSKACCYTPNGAESTVYPRYKNLHLSNELEKEKIILILQLILDTAARISMDDSKATHIVGLFIEIGKGNIMDSHHHPIEKSCEFMSKYQDMFHSLIIGWNFTFNRSQDKVSDIGSQLVARVNAPLLEVLLRQPNFDPNSQDSEGDTLLHILVTDLMRRVYTGLGNDMQQHMAVLFMLLSHPEINIAIENSNGDTALDILCQQQTQPFDQFQFLSFIKLLGLHASTTGELIHRTLTFLLNNALRVKYLNTNKNIYQRDIHEYDDIYDRITAHPLQYYGSCLQNIRQTCTTKQNKAPSMVGTKKLYEELVTELCDHISFDLNQTNTEGSTIGHIAATNKNSVALELIITREKYDPNIKDRHGNTALFYIFQKFSIDIIFNLYKKCPWDITVTNKYEESIYEYCKNVQTLEPKDRLLCYCQKLFPQENKALGYPCAHSQQTPVERVPRPVSFVLLPSDTRQASVLKPSRQNTIDLIHGSPQKVYNLKKARKGKALIISNHTFDVPWLKRLDGYTDDKGQLKVLWDQMGFDVYYPTCEGTDSVLTAQEMESAVSKFSEELTEADDCAVLCVLSHGGDGFVFGSDGKQVKIYSLLKPLDNQHCQVMVGKPKVIIVQACNGTTSDSGTCQTAGPGLAEPAANVDTNPLLSDMIVCSPSMPGYVSYVYRTPGQGSVFIQTLVDVYKEYAASEDIHDLHIRVNEKIADKTIQVQNPDGSIVAYKQMPRFESSLRKRLYFMPSAGGKHGENWIPVKCTALDKVPLDVVPQNVNPTDVAKQLLFVVLIYVLLFIFRYYLDM